MRLASLTIAPTIELIVEPRPPPTGAAGSLGAEPELEPEEEPDEPVEPEEVPVSAMGVDAATWREPDEERVVPPEVAEPEWRETPDEALEPPLGAERTDDWPEPEAEEEPEPDEPVEPLWRTCAAVDPETPVAPEVAAAEVAPAVAPEPASLLLGSAGIAAAAAVLDDESTAGVVVPAVAPVETVRVPAVRSVPACCVVDPDEEDD